MNIVNMYVEYNVNGSRGPPFYDPGQDYAISIDASSDCGPPQQADVVVVVVVVVVADGLGDDKNFAVVLATLMEPDADSPVA
jgi:hypothetical protein